MNATEPNAALLTPKGRGAVATVRVLGPIDSLATPLDRYFQAANHMSIAEQEIGRICFGCWQSAQHLHEEVVVCRASDASVEINCHGGHAAVNRILQDLATTGILIVPWQDQVRHDMDPVSAECFEALSRATTTRAAVILLEQQQGVLQREFARLLRLAGQSLTSSNDPAVAFEQLSEEVDSVLKWAEFGLHLSEPWRVVIVGRPNVGKSTLINALLGYSRAIVFDQPGTTRDVVTGETAFDGWPVVLSDTAGLRERGDLLETQGMLRTKQALATADCRCLVVDVSQPPTAEDRRLLTEIADAPRTLVIGNKVDLGHAWGSAEPRGIIKISAATGAGLDRLIAQLVATLVPVVPDAGTPVPVSQRQIQLLTTAQLALEQRNSEVAIETLSNLVFGANR